jgi:hypothetical protein
MHSANYSLPHRNSSAFALVRSNHDRTMDYRLLTASLLSAVTILFAAVLVLGGPLAS